MYVQTWFIGLSLYCTRGVHVPGILMIFIITENELFFSPFSFKLSNPTTYIHDVGLEEFRLRTNLRTGGDDRRQQTMNELLSIQSIHNSNHSSR
jgi:hypothetical protein